MSAREQPFEKFNVPSLSDEIVPVLIVNERLFLSQVVCSSGQFPVRGRYAGQPYFIFVRARLGCFRFTANQIKPMLHLTLEYVLVA